MVVLSFIPVPDVQRVWQFLGQEGMSFEVPGVITVLDYFDATWLNGQFYIEQWNHYGNCGPRTDKR